MVKVNLMEPRTDWRKNVFVALFSLSFLGLILLVLPLWNGQSVEPRPLGVEERETLVSVTDRLEARIPELSPWLKDFRYSILHDEFDIAVRQRLLSRDLVTQSGRSIVFSPKFFESDTSAQEQALLQVLVVLRSQMEPESDVAYSE